MTAWRLNVGDEDAVGAVFLDRAGGQAQRASEFGGGDQPGLAHLDHGKQPFGGLPAALRYRRHLRHVRNLRTLRESAHHVAVTERVYAVHTTRPDDIGAVEIVFGDEQQARAYAADRSRDYRVVAASVTEFRVGELGTRQSVAWFRDGMLQDERGLRPGPLYPAEPWAKPSG